MATTIAAAIARAASQIGGYFPGNSPYGEWYASRHGDVYNNAQFCAMGLSWVFAQEDALDIFPEHAYTPSGVSWFKSKRRWHNGLSGIRRGDVAYFDFPGAPDRVSHVGIVESVNADGSVNTIEFNTSGAVNGDQRNGRVVARKRRKAYIVGYGRPVYAGAAPAPVESSNNAGFSSEYVAARQAELNVLGYGLAVDGSRGPLTVAAIKDFQTKNGLTPDGLPGPLTAAKLALATKPSTPKRPNCTVLQTAVRAAPDNSWGPDVDKRLTAVREASIWAGTDFPYGVAYAQRVVGAVPDNRWGPKSKGRHRETVARVQVALRSMGFSPGRIDGDWGRNTESAYQSARKACRF